MKNLPTLQDLFENSTFNIPDYQRGYSWENQHRKDLLEDLEGVLEKGHYTGTIVLKESGRVNWYGKTFKKFDVVDGQQRLTTIIIFLNLISNELRYLNKDNACEISKNIKENYIKIKSKQESLDRLELDSENNNYFKEAIIGNNPSIERTIKSHDRLWDANNQFKEYLKDKKEESEDYLDYLIELINKLTQLLIFTLYKVENDAEVGIIFEVMNDRGKPLSQLEKVKNRLLFLTDRISNNEIGRSKLTEHINTSWKRILENLSKADKSKNEDENQFLRINYIINFYSELKTYTENGKRVSVNSQLSDVHKLMKDKFKELEINDRDKCYKQIKDYVDSLERMSDKYKDLINPFNELAFQNLENKDELKLLCSQLGRLNIQSNLIVLLLSIYESFYDQSVDLLKLFDLCEKFAFRLYYIGNWMSNTAQSKLYSLSNRVNKGKLCLDEVYIEIFSLLNQYAPEKEIEEQLTNSKKDYYQWKGLRYFLYEFERLRCQETVKKRPAFEWEDYKKMKKEDSIEHILPQTIRGKKRINYWAGRYDIKSHEKNVKKLGNLTLTTRNPELQNMDFNKKKEIYKVSSWQIERDIAKYKEWTEKEIQKHESELINFAIQRWAIKTDHIPKSIIEKSEGSENKVKNKILFSERDYAYIEFWDKLSAKYKQFDPTIYLRKNHPRSYYDIPIGKGGISYHWRFTNKGYFEAGLWIGTNKRNKNKEIINRIIAQKDRFENKLGHKLLFVNNEINLATQVHIRYEKPDIDIIKTSKEEKDKIIEWAIKNTPKFIEIIQPIINEY